MTELLSLFPRYPLWAGEKAIHNAKQESPKFIPSVPQVEEACEYLTTAPRNALTYAEEWDRRSQLQLTELDRIEREAEPLEHRRAVVKRILGEYRANVMSEIIEKSRAETPEQIKKRFSISDEQWNAIPNRPAQ